MRTGRSTKDLLANSTPKGATPTNPLNQRWKRKGHSSFRWSPSMSRFLLSLLAEQAKSGNPNFRRHSFTNVAAKAVSEHYRVSVTDTNVSNHVRTIRGRYRAVRRLQAMDNVSWDDEKKMIVMDEADYNAYVKENPKDEPYINKKIELYDEMCIICEHGNHTSQNLFNSDNEEGSDSDNECEDSVKEPNSSSPHESKKRRTQGQDGSASSSRGTKRGSTNFRWTPYMSRMLLSYIVDQIKHGLLKCQIMASSAQFVTEKVEMDCTVVNVENHLRTIRGRYLRIKRLQLMDGVTWDEERKMILLDDVAYNEHIKNEPKDEPYLNKKIDMYDEMLQIFGNEQVDNDFQSEWTNQEEEVDAVIRLITDGPDHRQSQSQNEAEDSDRELPDEPSSFRSPKRITLNNGNVNDNGDQYESAKWAMGKLFVDLSTQMGSIAKSIGDLANTIKSNNERDICEELYREVMKCEGYNEVLLAKAFDYLNEHAHLARGFLVKSHQLRHVWLSEFFSRGGHVR